MREDIKKRRSLAVRYLAITAFCLIASVIYSFFSHGIHSFWMRYLALWPFVFGAVPSVLSAAGVLSFPEGINVSEYCRDIYRFGIAALTVASFLKGVLEIAGTDSIYPAVLLYAGAAMLVIGAPGLFFFGRRRS